MKRLTSVFLQIDEAASYISDGRLEHLRLALILLDNAAEIQMYLRIQQELKEESWKKGFKEKVLEKPPERLPDSLKEFIEWEPIGLEKKRKLNRFFDEKVKYLCKDLDLLDSNLGDVLSYLHKYRNETYHKVRIRSETILTATKLLLEINLEMINLIPTNGHAYVSNEDYSWINNKLGYNAASAFLDEEVRNDFVDKVRSKLSISNTDIIKFLVSHIQSRLIELNESLDFICEMIKHCKTKDDAIRFSNYIKAAESEKFTFDELAFEDFESKISIEDINYISSKLIILSNKADRINAFKLFSILEVKLEEVEEPVFGIVSELDYMIQMEIDRRRGK